MFDFFTNRKLKHHVGSVDKHFTALNNRYLNVYGDVIEASRTHDPKEMLAYLANSAGIKTEMKFTATKIMVSTPSTPVKK